MKVLRGFVEMQIRVSKRIDDMQFGFTSGHGATNLYHGHLGINFNIFHLVCIYFC